MLPRVSPRLAGGAGLALLCGLVRSDSCTILGMNTFIFHDRTSQGAWHGSVQLEEWQAGATVTLSFHTNTELTVAEHSTIVRSSPRVIVVLLGQPAPENKLRLEGVGGCWQSKAELCKAELSCENGPSPRPPPLVPRPSPPPPPIIRSIEPSVVSATCHTVQLVWDSPLPPDRVPEYLVTMPEQPHFRAETMQNAFTLGGLDEGTDQHVQISYRQSGEESWSRPGPATEVATASVMRDAGSLQINVARSTGSCTSLRLGIPEFGKCNPSEFISVDWRVARTHSWSVVMDEIRVGDLPDNVLSVDNLDALSRYEFRVKLHQATADGGGVLEGPSTGALLVDMRSNELKQAPIALATSSASVRLTLPSLSQCRKGLQIRLLHTNEGQHEGWALVPSYGLARAGDGFVMDNLRCPTSCQFKLRYPTLIGWETSSATSLPVSTARLPRVADGHERLEVRMSISTSAEEPEASWGQGFSKDVATALALDPSEVRVVETRARGRFVIFDVPASYGSSKEPPSGRLIREMQRPLCRRGSNRAVGRRGRVSSSCRSQNSTSPSLVNDGDLRQHAPFAWQACPEDASAWWAVELEQPVTDPVVRVLLGTCCTERYNNELTLHIGMEEAIETATLCANVVRVEDASAVVAKCTGSGTWLFVAARSKGDAPAPGLALAEVEICEARLAASSLYSGEFSRGLDVSGGVLRLHGNGTTSQLAAQLLPDGMGRDASWRTDAGPGAWAGQRTWMSLAAMAFLVMLASAVSRRRLSLNSKARHARLRNDACDFELEIDEAASTGEQEPVSGSDEKVVETDEDDDILGERVPITFETRDGAVVHSSVGIANVESMEHFFTKVARAGTAVGFNAGDHMAVQYTDPTSQRTEQAWYDPILREGSDVEVVKMATSLRVLLLGDVNVTKEHEGAAPSDLTAGPLPASMAAAGSNAKGSGNLELHHHIFLGDAPNDDEEDLEHAAVSRI